MKIVHKACPCVLRSTENGVEILAFRHPMAGVQIPKGTVEPDETIEHAVLRELTEETGIADCRIVSKIGQFERNVGGGEYEDGELELHVWHLYHVTTDHRRETWRHQPSGSGVETRFVFECFWHALGDTDTNFHKVFSRVLDMVNDHFSRNTYALHSQAE